MASSPSHPDRQKTDTPVGQTCGGRTTEIKEGDRGYILGHLKANGETGTTPYHRECLLHDVSGTYFGCTCIANATPEQARECALNMWRKPRGRKD